MRTYRPKVGPFLTAYHFEHDEIDQLCLDALKQGKFLPGVPSPIRIEAFIESYFECTVDYRDLGSGVLGFTAFSSKGKVTEVVVSSALADGTESNNRRLNSTFAHEAGHCLLHAGLFIDAGRELIMRDDVDLGARKILCRDNQVGYGQRAGSRWWEYQANRAIGGFLLPRALVEESVADCVVHGVVTGSPQLVEARRHNAEQHVADIFKVNPVVARYRLEELYPLTSGQATF